MHLLICSKSSVRYIPSWFPGAGWKRKGEAYRANMDQMVAVPHQFVKDQMVSSSNSTEYC